MVVTGEFIPESEEPQVSTINVGTLKATTSDEDKYCMLGSRANVMVVPLMRDMKGDKTMFPRRGQQDARTDYFALIYRSAYLFSGGG